jgi:hypothetical protein
LANSIHFRGPKKSFQNFGGPLSKNVENHCNKGKEGGIKGPKSVTANLNGTLPQGVLFFH